MSVCPSRNATTIRTTSAFPASGRLRARSTVIRNRMANTQTRKPDPFAAHITSFASPPSWPQVLFTPAMSRTAPTRIAAISMLSDHHRIECRVVLGEQCLVRLKDGIEDDRAVRCIELQSCHQIGVVARYS